MSQYTGQRHHQSQCPLPTPHCSPAWASAAALVCPHLWSRCLICLMYSSSPTLFPGSLTGLALILPLIPQEVSLLGHSPHTRMFTGYLMKKFCGRFFFSVSNGRGVHFFFLQTLTLSFDHHWELFLHLPVCSN